MASKLPQITNVSFQSSSAKLLNGIAGILGVTIAKTSSRLYDMGFYSEPVVQCGGMLVVALTILNGVFMLQKNTGGTGISESDTYVLSIPRILAIPIRIRALIFQRRPQIFE